MSGISQVFEMDDILVLSEAITALSGGDLKKKMGILSSALSSVFVVVTFGVPDSLSISRRNIENRWIQGS